MTNWVSPTQIANVILGDHLVDWIQIYNKETVEKPSEFLQFLFKQGNTFEEQLVSKIKIPVTFITSRYNKSLLIRTLCEMKKGSPIIWGVPLSSQTREIYGTADLLIRSDYINLLVPNTISPEEETRGCLLAQNYHYRVIDIKFSTLPLRADGVHLLNQDRYKAYKAQVWLYTQMVGELQGYCPHIAYIMGRGYNYTSNGVTYKGTSSFDKLAVVDFGEEGVDSDIPSKSNKAIEWIRNLRYNGANWSWKTHPELYPNMKLESCLLEKSRIAKEIGEITQLWQCGVEQREIAFAHGITSFYDPRFTAELVGFKEHKALTLNRILEVNRCKEKVFLPEKFVNIPPLLKKKPKEYFVDFEVFTGVFDDFKTLPFSNSLNMMFMISVAWREERGEDRQGEDTNQDEIECCTTFCINSLSLEEEARLIKRFIDFVGTDSYLYHWSDAEPLQWKSALNRHNISDDILKDRWIDILHLFKEEPITIQGCFSYSLKEVVKSLRSLGFINTEWNSETSNGKDAMLHAFYEFNKGLTLNTSHILRDISKYNQTDCTAICEILTFLREKNDL